MSSIVPSQSTKPPPELEARAVLVEEDPDEDEIAIATDEELELEELEEPLEVETLKALAEPAIASPALNAAPSKTPSNAKFFRVLSIDIPPLFFPSEQPYAHNSLSQKSRRRKSEPCFGAAGFPPPCVSLGVSGSFVRGALWFRDPHIRALIPVCTSR